MGLRGVEGLPGAHRPNVTLGVGSSRQFESHLEPPRPRQVDLTAAVFRDFVAFFFGFGAGLDREKRCSRSSLAAALTSSGSASCERGRDFFATLANRPDSSRAGGGLEARALLARLDCFLAVDSDLAMVLRVLRRWTGKEGSARRATCYIDAAFFDPGLEIS